jgi:glycosyltransferase involved in cell wall biosynthesis
MKILLITNGFPSKGHLAGMFLPDLVGELNRLGCDVHVLTQNCDTQNTESETLWEGCKVTYFGWKGRDTPLIHVFERGLSSIFFTLHFFLNGIRAGCHISKQWKPDFIFAEWLIPAGLISYGVSKFRGIPYAARALGSDVLVVTKNPLIRGIVRFVARHAAVLFADGFDLCKRTSEIAGGKECHFAATSRRMGQKRSDFKPFEDDGLFTTLTVGRLHRVKGQDLLIGAAKILWERGVQFRFYIVGEGEGYPSLSKQIWEMGLGHRVILTGKLEDGDLIDLLVHVDCVVIPSRSETIPLVFKEAVEAKKPLIVTDVGDMKYLVEHYHLGYVVPKEDDVGLADGIEKMSKTQDRSQFIQSGDRIGTLLSVEKAAQIIREELAKYLSLLQENRV